VLNQSGSARYLVLAADTLIDRAMLAVFLSKANEFRFIVSQ